MVVVGYSHLPHEAQAAQLPIEERHLLLRHASGVPVKAGREVVRQLLVRYGSVDALGEGPGLGDVRLGRLHPQEVGVLRVGSPPAWRGREGHIHATKNGPSIRSRVVGVPFGRGAFLRWVTVMRRTSLRRAYTSVHYQSIVGLVLRNATLRTRTDGFLHMQEGRIRLMYYSTTHMRYSIVGLLLREQRCRHGRTISLTCRIEGQGHYIMQPQNNAAATAKVKLRRISTFFS